MDKHLAKACLIMLLFSVSLESIFCQENNENRKNNDPLDNEKVVNSNNVGSYKEEKKLLRSQQN